MTCIPFVEVPASTNVNTKPFMSAIFLYTLSFRDTALLNTKCSKNV